MWKRLSIVLEEETKDQLFLFLGGFYNNLGNSFALHAELVGVMITIETVVVRGWTKHWIERDSMLVIKAFKTSYVIHCKLRNR